MWCDTSTSCRKSKAFLDDYPFIKSYVYNGFAVQVLGYYVRFLATTRRIKIILKSSLDNLTMSTLCREKIRPSHGVCCKWK